MRKDQGCSCTGSYHIAGCLPSPDVPLDSSQKQLREHSGRLAGSRESHGDSSGKLLAVGC